MKRKYDVELEKLKENTIKREHIFKEVEKIMVDFSKEELEDSKKETTRIEVAFPYNLVYESVGSLM